MVSFVMAGRVSVFRKKNSSFESGEPGRSCNLVGWIIPVTEKEEQRSAIAGESCDFGKELMRKPAPMISTEDEDGHAVL